MGTTSRGMLMYNVMTVWFIDKFFDMERMLLSEFCKADNGPS